MIKDTKVIPNAIVRPWRWCCKFSFSFLKFSFTSTSLSDNLSTVPSLISRLHAPGYQFCDGAWKIRKWDRAKLKRKKLPTCWGSSLIYVPWYNLPSTWTFPLAIVEVVEGEVEGRWALYDVDFRVSKMNAMSTNHIIPFRGFHVPFRGFHVCLGYWLWYDSRKNHHILR